MFKPIPTPGYQYEVKAGDSLNNIETTAYGYIAGVLEGANPGLTGRALSAEGRPVIYRGSKLLIPVLAQIEEIKVKSTINKPSDEITLVLEDREVKYTSIRVIVGIEQAADGWSASIPYPDKDDYELVALTVAYRFPKAKIYIGGKLVIAGKLYNTTTDLSIAGNTMTLEGFSNTVDLIDSTMPPPYEVAKIGLEDWINRIAGPKGMKAVMEVDPGGPFDRITGDRGERIGSVIQKLCDQRSLLFTSSPEGNPLFTRAATSKPVGTLEIGGTSGDVPLSLSAKFDGRKMFNEYTAYSQSPKSPKRTATATDANVPVSRTMAFKANESTDGNIQDSADWMRSRQSAESITIPVPVVGFYAPDGTMWKANSRVIIKSRELFMPDGFEMLITQVEFVTDSGGKTATLRVAPPTVYTGGEVEWPWTAL